MDLQPTLKTPLLMPPRLSRLESWKHSVTVQQHNFNSWRRSNQQALHLAFKLFVFLIKMLSITRPCAPLVMREVVWWPLMSLAALELAFGNKIGWGGIGSLGVVHALVLLVVMRFGGGLCSQRGLNWRYD